MADRRGISTDRRWRAAGIGALMLAVVVLTGAIVVAHARQEQPIPIVSSAPLGNQKPMKVVVVGDSSRGTRLRAVWDQRAGTNWISANCAKMIDITAHISDEVGSGYVARGNKGTTFGDKVHSLVEPGDNIVIIFGGTSDAAEKPESVEAAVSDAFSMCARHRRVPSRSLSVRFPPQQIRGRRCLGSATLSSGRRQKLTVFVDPIADQWLVGDPNLTRQYGLGATDAGHAYIADKLLPIIQRVLVSAASGS